MLVHVRSLSQSGLGHWPRFAGPRWLATKRSAPPAPFIDFTSFPTVNLGETKSLKCTLTFPPEYDKAEKLPFLHVFPHTAISARTQLAVTLPVFLDAWATGALPRCAIGSWACPQKREQYRSACDGSQHYGRLFTEDWLPFARARCSLTPYVAVSGQSAGGGGALDVALQHPEMISCVAAQNTPGDPVDMPRKVRRRWLYDRNDHQAHDPFLTIHKTFANLTRSQMGGVDTKDWDLEHWRTESCNLWKVRDNAHRIRESRMRIFLTGSAFDCMGILDVVEAVHRELLKHDIPHSYRLEANNYHFGKSNAEGLKNQMAWVGSDMRAAMEGEVLDTEQQQHRERMPSYIKDYYGYSDEKL